MWMTKRIVCTVSNFLKVSETISISITRNLKFIGLYLNNIWWNLQTADTYRTTWEYNIHMTSLYRCFLQNHFKIENIKSSLACSIYYFLEVSVNEICGVFCDSGPFSFLYNVKDNWGWLTRLADELQLYKK